MATGGPPAAPRRRRPSSRFFRRALTLPDPESFPFRQYTPAGTGSLAETEARIRAALAATDFEPVTIAPSVDGGPAPARSWIVMERNFGRGPAGLRKRAAILGLLVCGVILGVVDAYLFKNAEFGIPWVLSTAVAASVLYVAFGRAYESDLVAVRLRPARPAASGVEPAPPRPASIVWLGARVRSEIFSGTAPHTREAVEVAGELSALQSLRDAANAYGTAEPASARIGSEIRAATAANAKP